MPSVRRPKQVVVRERLVLGLAAAIFLIVGTSVAMLFVDRGDDGRTPFDGPSTVASFPFEAAESVRPVSIESAFTPMSPATEPASARKALEAFLEAERDGDAETAFALLSEDAQERATNPAGWQQQRATRLVPESFKIGAEERDDEDAVTITVTSKRTPSVDPFAGFLPAASTEKWRLVKENAGWRLRSGRPSEVDPEMPTDAEATTVAGTWLKAASSCDLDAVESTELDANLLGSLDLREQPCDRKDLKIGEVVEFAEIGDVAPFVAAYGPSVGRWARAVMIEPPPGAGTTDGTGTFALALAPLGSTWRVMGYIPLEKGGR